MSAASTETCSSPVSAGPRVHQYPLRLTVALFERLIRYASRYHDGSIAAAIRHLIADGLERADSSALADGQ